MTRPNRKSKMLALSASALTLAAALALPAQAQNQAKEEMSAPAQERQPPNIIVIMPDDVGVWNVGAYSHGMMVPTPNIDRIAREGILFTDHYAHPSSTPGRAGFITGQLPVRTGLTTVGLPGSPVGLDARDPTMAELLKEKGYRTGQFGKNHLGDRNSHLPTVHGFDEFFGNLYHLNTEEEPELAAWPKNNPEFDRKYRPRGVLDCVATNVNDPSDDGRSGPMGKQKCVDTGPLTTKRMETVDEEFLGRTMEFIKDSKAQNKPFFAWFNSSRMHIYTHLKPESRNLATEHSSQWDIYGSGLMEHDGHVGQILALLDELQIAENTIVLFTTDNGAMAAWWPDGGTTPFRGEKATTWEGGVRVPMLVRWPAAIKAGSVSNGIQTHEDLFATLLSAAGVKNVRERLAKEAKVYIDGVDNLENWTNGAPSKRNSVIYYNENDLTAVRIGPWKSHIMTREGFFDYQKPSAKIFNLRQDPFEQRDGQKADDIAMALGVAYGGQIAELLGEHYATLAQFPPRQKSGTLKMDTTAK
jgi:arylsulfatase A-like enzyme